MGGVAQFNGQKIYRFELIHTRQIDNYDDITYKSTTKKKKKPGFIVNRYIVYKSAT